MDLDDLKGIWKSNTQQNASDLLKDEELHAMLHAKASNTIDLLKRSVRFELWSTVLFIAFFIVVILTTNDQHTRNLSLASTVLGCGFGYYYYRKLLLLNNLNADNRSIKENLTYLVTKFENFLWFYRWGFNILVPIALIVGALAGIYIANEIDFFQIISQVKLWAILMIIFIPITIIFNFGMKWYVKKLYGNHLSHLQFLLKELHD